MKCLSPSAPGAPVITQQKFVAELQMLRTRAKELGLPITANMIGIALDAASRERAEMKKEQNKCATGKDGENTSAVKREAEEEWNKRGRSMDTCRSSNA